MRIPAAILRRLSQTPSRRGVVSPIFHPGVTRRVRTMLLPGLVAVTLLQGCSDAAARSPLANAESSEGALVEAVLGALADKDRVALQGFLLSREEYETHLWPELPDREYTPFEFVWSLNEANSRKGLSQLLSTYGGLELELVSIRFTEEPEVHESFTLHPGAEVTVRRADTGDEGVLPSFDVLVEYGGGWKLLNYDEL
jgi:hypothetical protein